MPSITLTVTPTQAARVQAILDARGVTAQEFLLSVVKHTVISYEEQEARDAVSVPDFE